MEARAWHDVGWWQRSLTESRDEPGEPHTLDRLDPGELRGRAGLVLRRAGAGRRPAPDRQPDRFWIELAHVGGHPGQRFGHRHGRRGVFLPAGWDPAHRIDAGHTTAVDMGSSCHPLHRLHVGCHAIVDVHQANRHWSRWRRRREGSVQEPIDLAQHRLVRGAGEAGAFGVGTANVRKIGIRRSVCARPPSSAVAPSPAGGPCESPPGCGHAGCGLLRVSARIR